jgi:hypothetical protein
LVSDVASNICVDQIFGGRSIMLVTAVFVVLPAIWNAMLVNSAMSVVMYTMVVKWVVHVGEHNLGR